MKSSSFGKVLLTIMVVCLFAAGSAYAQDGTTSLRGTVTDVSGASVGDAKLTLDNLGQAFHSEALTNTVGAYEFLALPPGKYALTVEKTGFRRFEHKNLELLVNSPATENVALEIGTTSQTIEVSAQTVTLNTTDASLGNAFNENQVKQLPLEGRNIPDLLSLQAGVVYTSNRRHVPIADTRSGEVNGARSDQSNVTLDGVPVNDSGGHAFTTVLPATLDSVQEFRTTTSNYNADQGGSSGAQVSMVTKSGTDEFHGSADAYTRHTYTSANDYFVKKAELNSGNPNQPPKLIRNIFGGSLGGPVVKKRAYFFLNYEGQRRAEEQSAVREVPTESLKDGVIYYQCDASSPPILTDCPGGSVTGMSGKSYTVPAPVTTANGVTAYFALNPNQITAMDPQG